MFQCSYGRFSAGSQRFSAGSPRISVDSQRYAGVALHEAYCPLGCVGPPGRKTHHATQLLHITAVGGPRWGALATQNDPKIRPRGSKKNGKKGPGESKWRPDASQGARKLPKKIKKRSLFGKTFWDAPRGAIIRCCPPNLTLVQVHFKPKNRLKINPKISWILDVIF